MTYWIKIIEMMSDHLLLPLDYVLKSFWTCKMLLKLEMGYNTDSNFLWAPAASDCLEFTFGGRALVCLSSASYSWTETGRKERVEQEVSSYIPVPPSFWSHPFFQKLRVPYIHGSPLLTTIFWVRLSQKIVTGSKPLREICDWVRMWTWVVQLGSPIL